MRHSASDFHADSTEHVERGSRRTALRVFQWKSLGMIAVYEQDPLPGESERELVFETVRGTVKLSGYPDDWQRMSDEQLMALSGSAPKR
jgi:hypothetical protein